MARYIAAGILVGFLGLYHFAAGIYALPQSTSQGATGTVTAPPLREINTQTFLQNVQRLELLGKWSPPVHELRMSIMEDDEDEPELSNNPAWQESPLVLRDCKALGGLYCGPDPSTPAWHGKEIHLLLEIRNDGNQDAVIIIGGGCGIRASGLTSNVEITLTDSRETSFPLHFLGIGPPYQAGCAGGAAVFSATIGPRNSFAAVLNLGEYMNLSDNQSYALYHLPVGTYTLQAHLELRSSSAPGGLAAQSFGTLTSNTIQVQFDSAFSIFYFPKRVAP